MPIFILAWEDITIDGDFEKFSRHVNLRCKNLTLNASTEDKDPWSDQKGSGLLEVLSLRPTGAAASLLLLTIDSELKDMRQPLVQENHCKVDLGAVQIDIEPRVFTNMLHLWGGMLKAQELAFQVLYGCAQTKKPPETQTQNATAQKSSSDSKTTVSASSVVFALRWGPGSYAEISIGATTVIFQKHETLKNIRQIRGSLCSVRITDKVGPKSGIFHQVLGAQTPGLGVDIEWQFIPAHAKNGSAAKSAPVFNLRSSGVCLVYVHRVIMDLIEYVMDWIVGKGLRILRYPSQDLLAGSRIQLVVLARGKSWVQGGPLSFTALAVAPTKKSDSNTNQNQVAEAAHPAECPFDLAVIIQDFEAVVPSGSSHYDGIVIRSPQLSIWCSWGGIEPFDCKGPFFTSKLFSWELTDPILARKASSADVELDSDFQDANTSSADLEAYLEAKRVSCEDILREKEMVFQKLQAQLKASLNHVESTSSFSIDTPNEVDDLINEVNLVDGLEKDVAAANEEYQQSQLKLKEAEEELEMMKSSLFASGCWNRKRPDSTVNIEFNDVVFLSLLSDNVIVKGIDVHLWVSGPTPKSPGGACMYPSVYSALGYATPFNPCRWNPIDVIIVSPSPNITFTQSQYAIILDMLFVNFCEPCFSPTVWPSGTPIVGTETIIEDPLGHASLKSRVPIYFKTATISVRYDDDSYHNRLASINTDPTSTDIWSLLRKRVSGSDVLAKSLDSAVLHRYLAKNLLVEIDRMNSCDGSKLIVQVDSMSVIDPSISAMDLKHSILTRTNMEYSGLQIAYSQENGPNYRKCSVLLQNTSLYFNVDKLFEAVLFWCDPIWERPGDPYLQNEEKIMDIEVIAENLSIMCFDQGNNNPEVAMRAEGNITYSRMLRNFWWIGPGTIQTTLSIEMFAVSLGPSCSSRMEMLSLVNPFIFEKHDTFMYNKGWTMPEKNLGDRTLIQSTTLCLKKLVEDLPEDDEEVPIFLSSSDMAASQYVNVYFTLPDIAFVSLLAKSMMKASEQFGLSRRALLSQRKAFADTSGSGHKPYDENLYVTKSQVVSTYIFIAGLSLIMVNMENGEAILKFTIENLKAEMHTDPELSFLSKVVMHSSYLNQALYVWEPILEPVPIECELKKRDVSKDQPQLQVQVVVPESLNLNLTPALSQLTFQEAPWDLLQHMQKSTPAHHLSKPVFHQYSIRNRTGCKLVLIIQEITATAGQTRRKAARNSIEVPIESGEEFQLDYRILAKLSQSEKDLKTANQHLHTNLRERRFSPFLRIEILGNTFESTRAIPIDIVGQHCLPLNDTQAVKIDDLEGKDDFFQLADPITAFDPVVVAEVALNEGWKKQITLRGKVTVANFTGSQLEVLFYNSACQVIGYSLWVS